MTSPTLVQSALLCQDMLQRGVIESTILTDRFFEILPMKAVSGNAYAYNRENVIGDSQGLYVGGTITATAAATVTQVSTSLKTLIGQTEVNKMIQATRSNINDQVGYQIASKAKSVGNLFRSYLINGVSSTTQFDGLLTLVDAGKTVSATGTDGDVLSFAKLDELLDQVTDKDGKVDYIMMNPREIRAYKALCRALVV